MSAQLITIQDTSNPTVTHVYIQNNVRNARITVTYTRQVLNGNLNTYTIQIAAGGREYIGYGCVFASYTNLCSTPIYTQITGVEIHRQLSEEEMKSFVPESAKLVS